MDVFLVRQAIYDCQRNVYAYEIVYRKGSKKSSFSIPESEASAQEMFQTFQNYGINNLTCNKPAFISFTDKLIKEEIAANFSRRELVVELLNDIELDKEVLNKCIALKKKRYRLALDDFVYNEGNKALGKIADIIKINFREASRAQIETMIEEFKDYNIQYLAENIDNCEDFEYAKNLGFKLFQGCFCQKLEKACTQRIPSVKTSYLKVMNEVNKSDLNFDNLADLLSKDANLSDKILQLVNSDGFAFNAVNSVKQALVLLGTRELKKCINLVVLKELGSGESEEIVRLSLIRARFCELIAEEKYAKAKASDLFLVGLFSLMDTIIHKPLEEIFKKIEPVPKVEQALLEKSGEYAAIYQIVLHYEQGLLEEVEAEKKELGITDRELMDFYIKSLLWYNSLTHGAKDEWKIKS